MNITDHLQKAADAAAPDGLDLRRIARSARVNGTRARRRRRGTALLACAAVLGAGSVGATEVLGHAAGSVAVTAMPAGQPILDPLKTGPSTGPGLAAALRFAVGQVEQGRAGAFAAQQGHEAYARLDWTDADGRGVSVIGINVQPVVEMHAACTDPEELRCTRTRSHGSTLTSYVQRTRVRGGVAIERTVDLWRADGSRVAIQETNGYDLGGNKWRLTRRHPPLTFAQLTRIVRRPWWGSRLPAYFLDQGKQLKPYDDLDQPWPT